MSRRLGPNIANILISALTHGIYAGDSAKLSIKSCFKSLYDYEKKYNSIILGMLRTPKVEPDFNDICDGNLDRIEFIKAVQRDASIYSLHGGMQELSDSLVDELKKRENVDLRLAVGCNSIEIDETLHVCPYVALVTPYNAPHMPFVQVNMADSSTLQPAFLVSTLPAYSLLKILPTSIAATVSPDILNIPYVNVAVINLIYNNPSILPLTGFGYLIPKTENEVILGVIFDSCALPSPVSYTKLTVMIGGHHFNNPIFKGKQFTDAELTDIAIDGLKRHLGITEKPNLIVSGVHKQCIPQYLVGHDERITRVKASLEEEWGRGRIVLSGAGLNGVGVGINDCIGNARDIAKRIVNRLR